MEKVTSFLKRKDIEISLKRYFIDALGAMAQGLFCSLLIGTIINTIGQQAGIPYLETIGGFATAMAGPLMKEAKPPAVYPVPLMVISSAVRNPMPNWVPRVFKIVPMSREQNRPWAIAPRASIP